jgi:hypothetical protein
MSRRLYFILPDVETSRKVEQELLLARIEDKRMHFLAKRGTDMKDLPEATHLQKTDLLRGIYVGLFAGALTGLLGGLYIYFTPDTVGMQVQPFVIFICAVVAAIIGAWISGPLIGGSTPNARLKEYQQELHDGHILLIIDVPSKRVDDVRTIIKQAHPQAEDRGTDPNMPAFP